MAYCRECGTEVSNAENFCRECGAEVDQIGGTGASESTSRAGFSNDTTEQVGREPTAGERVDTEPTADADRGWFDQYSTTVWIASLVFALLTFPIGLVIPGYFFIKASSNSSVDQTPLEVWTVVLLGIFGIAAVELGGKKGAKILWGILGAIVALFILITIAVA